MRWWLDGLDCSFKLYQMWRFTLMLSKAPWFNSINIRRDKKIHKYIEDHMHHMWRQGLVESKLNRGALMFYLDRKFRTFWKLIMKKWPHIIHEESCLLPTSCLRLWSQRCNQICGDKTLKDKSNYPLELKNKNESIIVTPMKGDVTPEWKQMP